MSSHSTVSTLRAGEALDGVFACVRKDRGISRSGSAYLTLELRDATGSVTGRIFRDADLLAGRFESGDIVHVKGRVERFRDELTVDVREIAKVEVKDEELARFLPSTRRDLDELEGFLEHLVREIYDPGLRGLCERLLGNKAIRSELRRAPCGLRGERGGGRGVAGAGVADGDGVSAGGGGAGGVVGWGASRSGRGRGGSGTHHAYLGGLLEHTVAVATLALELCEVHPRLDRDLLLCAAIVHDIGRTREFSYGSEISRTEEGRLLGHVELGLRLIERNAPSSLPRERLLALEHCVATHHGQDGGGEVRFSSPEAVALHRVNALDAMVKGALERGLK